MGFRQLSSLSAQPSKCNHSSRETRPITLTT
jgi:hypothetical protein